MPSFTAALLTGIGMAVVKDVTRAQFARQARRRGARNGLGWMAGLQQATQDSAGADLSWGFSRVLLDPQQAEFSDLPTASSGIMAPRWAFQASPGVADIAANLLGAAAPGRVKTTCFS